MPPKIRESACSCATSHSVVYVCVTSGPLLCFQVALTATSFVPMASAITRAALAPIVAMLPAYDGYGGVGISVDHVASGSVAGLRSVSAWRIAVTGRHTP